MVVSVAEEMNPLRRSTMEDVHVIIPEGSWEISDFTYLAIYDGHGGRGMVDFLQHTLHHNLAMELQPETDSIEFPADIPRIKSALERAFLITDIQAHKFGISRSGSTVAVCLIHSSSRTLITANVGDARIVIGVNSNNSKKSTKTAIRLSRDHRADDPEEVTRIEMAGGFCLKGRVVGVLAVTRSLGDFGLKRYVVAEPHIQVHSYSKSFSSTLSPFSRASEEFVILACDGLWDVITDQQAVDLVNSSRRPKTEVADELIQYAMQNGTTDNVTVIVYWL
jgi:serine/threonine protein phosphatase PrpC